MGLNRFMNWRMAIKLIALGSLIVAVAYLLRGHDLLTGAALLALFAFVVAKVIFAIIYRRGHRPPPGSGGSNPPPGPPVRRPPGGRPPVLSAAAEIST